MSEEHRDPAEMQVVPVGAAGWLPPAPPLCCVSHWSGLYCDRELGHDGDHAAHAEERDLQVARWPERTRTQGGAA